MGQQVAVVPAAAGNIRRPLVRANPVAGMGATTGVTCTQPLKTQGGVAPAAACGAAHMGAKMTLNGPVGDIFWKAA